MYGGRKFNGDLQNVVISPIAIFVIQTYLKDWADMFLIAVTAALIIWGDMPGTALNSPAEFKSAPRNCDTEVVGRPAVIAAFATPGGRFSAKSGGQCLVLHHRSRSGDEERGLRVIWLA